MKPMALSRIANVAALLAVALLAFATVKSIVMQAEMASPLANAPMCGDMSGRYQRDKPDDAHKSALAFCAFCAAAAHTPLETKPDLLRTPYFVAWRLAVAHGKPALRDGRLYQANARGPPAVLIAA
jgi:Protein of unknown function (DUF2946)